MNALALSLLAWIATQTGLEAPATPSILLVSAEEIHVRSGRPFGAVALYSRDTATIYLPKDWNREQLYDQATLLHELVHHIQESNRVPSKCNAQRERQAYDLTLTWLLENGITDPYAFLNVDELTITILSACPPADGRAPGMRNPSARKVSCFSTA